MASDRDIHEHIINPTRALSVVGYLRSIPDAIYTEWEEDFLANLQDKLPAEQLSRRQVEVLLDLRDAAKSYTVVDGYNVAKLVRDCWIARQDLSEDDEEFIDRLKSSNTISLKRRAVLKLLACAKDLNLIDHFVPVT